jgi:2-polyprenyl-3-methyl-5-hydroxy-6-metoxy-1,4-benzoquinol methylase
MHMGIDHLKHRRRQPEWMDSDDIEASLHEQALRGLATVNWLSRSASILWPALWRECRHKSARQVRVLDLACGGGDVLQALAQRAQQRGLPIKFSGCDRSEVALRMAQANADRAGIDIELFPLNVLDDPLPVGFDVIMCSLFLHHLEEADAIGLLRKMAAAAGELVLVNDLRRSVLGYALALVGGRLITRSPVVHVDGPRSVEGAFTLAEVAALAKAAGLANVRIERKWPQRFLLTWRRR